MRSTHARWWLFSLLAGCGGAGTMDASSNDVVVNDTVLVDSNADDVAMGDDTPVTPADVATDTQSPADVQGDVAMGAYPPGPYGINEGDTLPPLNFEGYINTAGTAVSTTLPYAPTSMNALRMTGRGYGMVHLSEFI